ncbi:MAG: hypothetical protein NTX53_09630 [candidate division WOR-3 bacterium]|nr:hypothetical protein [candidate division WOR-3 bacterium]
MIRKNTLIVALAAVVLLIGTSCDTLVTLAKPTVSAAALDTDNGGTLRLTWTAVTDAKSYEITTDDSVYTTTATSIDISTPSTTVDARAVNGSDKSDPAVIDCKVVQTPSLVLYGISDASGNDPSGISFTSGGTATGLSLDAANKPSIDFVCDDQQASVTPVGLINAGDYTSWNPPSTKMNALMDAGTTDFDAFRLAASTGYTTQLKTDNNGVYILWLSTSSTWTANDHFCKIKIVSVEQPTGTYYKVTLKAAYQKIGGLRWLVQ